MHFATTKRQAATLKATAEADAEQAQAAEDEHVAKRAKGAELTPLPPRPGAFATATHPALQAFRSSASLF